MHCALRELIKKVPGLDMDVFVDNISLSVRSGAELVEEGEYAGRPKLDAALEVVGGEEWRKRGLILGDINDILLSSYVQGMKQCAFWVDISEVQKRAKRRFLTWWTTSRTLIITSLGCMVRSENSFQDQSIYPRQGLGIWLQFLRQAWSPSGHRRRICCQDHEKWRPHQI